MVLRFSHIHIIQQTSLNFSELLVLTLPSEACARPFFDFEGSLLVVNELKIRYSFVYHKAAQVH